MKNLILFLAAGVLCAYVSLLALDAADYEAEKRIHAAEQVAAGRVAP